MVRQWTEVEGYLAAEYGMTPRQILRGTSWRRLRVLLSRGFQVAGSASRTAEAPAPAPEAGRYDKYGGFDWNAALDKVIGRQTPDPRNVRRMSLDEFMRISR